jgi:hypothetical protein
VRVSGAAGGGACKTRSGSDALGEGATGPGEPVVPMRPTSSMHGYPDLAYLPTSGVSRRACVNHHGVSLRRRAVGGVPWSLTAGVARPVALRCAGGEVIAQRTGEEGCRIRCAAGEEDAKVGVDVGWMWNQRRDPSLSEREYITAAATEPPRSRLTSAASGWCLLAVCRCAHACVLNAPQQQHPQRQCPTRLLSTTPMKRH